MASEIKTFSVRQAVFRFGFWSAVSTAVLAAAAFAIVSRTSGEIGSVLHGLVRNLSVYGCGLVHSR